MPSRAEQALDEIRARFPERTITSIDHQIPHPLRAYHVGWACEECDFRTLDEEEALRHCDEKLHSLARDRIGPPYRTWDLPEGPWVLVHLDDGTQLAIWKNTGDVYRVEGPDGQYPGAVEDDPILGPNTTQGGRAMSTIEVVTRLPVEDKPDDALLRLRVGDLAERFHRDAEITRAWPLLDSNGDQMGFALTVEE